MAFKQKQKKLYDIYRTKSTAQRQAASLNADSSIRRVCAQGPGATVYKRRGGYGVFINTSCKITVHTKAAAKKFAKFAQRYD